jgi:hypothetical protein
MTTLCTTYSSHAAAQRAVEELTAAGVSDRDIRLIIGSRLHDLRSEVAGGFAGAIAADAPVGRYAGPPLPRWHAAGSFYGEPDRQRQGSFADAERDLLVSYDHGAQRSRLTGDQETCRLLEAANLNDRVARRVIDDLHRDHAVVLAEVAEIPQRAAHTRPDQIAHAA